MQSLHKRLALWGFLVVTLIALATVSFVNGVKIETDMLALLPATERDKWVATATERNVSTNFQRLVFLLRSSTTLESGERTIDPTGNSTSTTSSRELSSHASNIRSSLLASQLFASDDLMPDQQQSQSTLFQHRFKLLSDNDQALLSNDPVLLVKQARQRIYSLTGALTTIDLARDPLGLATPYFAQLVPQEFFPLAEGLMGFHANGRTHAVFFLTTRAATFSLDEQERLLKTINHAKEVAKSSNQVLLVTGLPLFAADGASSAKYEITLFGGISLVAVICLLLIAFRSIARLLFAFVAIGVGIAAAFTCTITVFGEVHIITLVFGCSLIGVSIDYVLHYLCDEYRISNWSASEGLHYIQPGVTTAAITTIAAFLTFTFSPFPGLQQIALFSATGLAMAAVTVLFAFPVFLSWLPRRQATTRATPILGLVTAYLHGWQKTSVPFRWLFAFGVACFTIFGLATLAPNDSIRVLQTADEKLLSDDRQLRTSLPGNYDNQFYVVRGSDAADVLSREERLLQTLHHEQREQGPKVERTAALNVYYPSEARQSAAYDALNSLFASEQIQSFQRELGISEEQIAQHEADFVSANDDDLTLESWLVGVPPHIQDLWLGCDGQTCASVVRIKSVAAAVKADTDADADASDRVTGSLSPVDLEHITYVDTAADLSALFERYRTIASALLGVVFVLAFVGLCLRYKLAAAFTIILIPTASMLFAAAVISVSGQLFSLFNLFALLLVMGISIDYAVFFNLGRKEFRGTGLAVLLSATTTILAFGMLTFSSTAVVSAFGLTLFAGVLFAFVVAPLASPLLRENGPPAANGQSPNDASRGPVQPRSTHRLSTKE